KVFLTDALVYFDGACEWCMIDNTHVVVLSGTGRQMVPVPEMAAFAERFRFTFRAHEVGDANRSAHVERAFDHVDNNFLAGRRFADWADLNAQAQTWCDKVNAAHRRHLHASPRELYQHRAHRRQATPLRGDGDHQRWRQTASRRTRSLATRRIESRPFLSRQTPYRDQGRGALRVWPRSAR